MPRLLRTGFTLIELLVVLALLALLLTLATPRYFGFLERSKEAVLAQNLEAIRGTIDKFYADRGRYPARLEELVEAKYLRTVPMDPLTESAATWRLIPPREDAAGGVYDVRSGAEGMSKRGIPYAGF